MVDPFHAAQFHAEIKRHRGCVFQLSDHVLWRHRFVASYIKTLQLDRLAHVATHSTLMTIQHLLKTIAFGLLGFAFSEWAGLICLLIAFGFAGTVMGRHVLARIDEKKFKFALTAILTVLALRLIYAGGTDLWAG